MCISSSNIRKIDKNSSTKQTTTTTYSTSENVQSVEKDNEPLQSIIEKHDDITPDENIEKIRSKCLAAKNASIMNKLMFEQ